MSRKTRVNRAISSVQVLIVGGVARNAQWNVGRNEPLRDLLTRGGKNGKFAAYDKFFFFFSFFYIL